MSNIISGMESPTLVCLEDDNGFIRRFATERQLGFMKFDKWDRLRTKITHAIVFDDGEEFPEIGAEIAELEIPSRYIKTLITRVINIKKEPKYNSQRSTSDYEYIGRGSYWGNPHSMYEAGEDRDEIIRKFKYDFDFEKFPNKEKSEVYRLAGKRLGCFCKPQNCHGDVLANFLNSWDDGR